MQIENKSAKSNSWDWEIKPQSTWLGASLKELYAYKDLLFRLVRKEFLVRYQQTLMGPLWLLIQPILTVFTYVVVFNKVIGLSTGGVPPVLFYLTGITLWSLFTDVFSGTSTTFTQNIAVFSKVYFPRIITPLSTLLLHCLRFCIQLALLLLIMVYYYFKGGISIAPINFLAAVPVVVVVAGIALGAGLIFSVLTAKYRDLANLIGLFISLLMFVSPVFYSLTIVPKDIQWFVQINPLTSQFELFRYAFVGKGDFSVFQLFYSTFFMLFTLSVGLLLFNKKGDALMDVI
jgi:lipopolysaccharide transport system permease protein